MIRALKIICFCWLSWACSGVTAQNDSVPLYQRGSHHLFLYASFGMNSTGLTNEFISEFYQGNYLTPELRNHVSGNLKDHNIAGYLLEGGLYYFFAPDKFEDKFGYYIGMEEHSMAEMSFRKGFFDLMFFGNEPFTGSTVAFDEMKLNFMTWQKFTAGIYKAMHYNGKMHQLGGGFGIIIGQQNLSLDVRKASLFTQQDAEYVELDVDVDVRRTDSTETGFGSYNGYGLSFDVQYGFNDMKHHEFQLKISDVGFIRWDQTPDNFTRDTTFRFEGFETDLLNFNSPALANAGDSMLDEVMGPKQHLAYVTDLPLDVHLYYTYTFKKKNFTISAEARHRFYSLYRPYFVLNAGYKCFFKKGSIGFFPELTYGGYGYFNAGLNIATQFGGHTFIKLGTSGLDALIAPHSRTGLVGTLTLYQRL